MRSNERTNHHGDRRARAGTGSTSPCAAGPLGRSLAVQIAVWAVLVGVAAVGRIWQPAWHVTPLAGVAVAAGLVFPSVVVAASVPVAALALSNLALPAYDSLPMAIVVFVATAWPVLLGPLGVLGTAARPRLAAVVGGGLAHSLVFYFTTNVAYWLLTSEYPRSAAGLVACLAAALPFYRWMPLGDAGWSLAIACVVAAAASRFGAARAVDDWAGLKPGA